MAMDDVTHDAPRLTREAVVAAALAIGDAEGVGAVSLRRVAGDLGVTPMALYRYVESKEALLDAMLERAYGEVELPAPDADWWDGLEAVARSARRAMVGHPAAAAVVAIRPGAGPNALRIVERILGLLRGAGFDTEQAVLFEATFTRFLLALVAFEASMLPEPSADERAQRARRTRFELESLPAHAFPNLIEAAPYIAAPYDPETTFDQALRLVRAGIEAQRAQPGRA